LHSLWGLGGVNIHAAGTWASAPLDAELLFKLDGSIIVGDFTGTVGWASKSDSVVDVEDSVGSAWGPDHGLVLDGILLGVSLSSLVLGSTEGCAGHGSLLGSLGEVVGGDEVGSDTWVKTDVSVISGLHDGHLVASWVSQSQVELAILLLIGSVGSRTLNGLELIETKGDDGLVWGQQSADTARWAAVARIASLLNGDLLGGLVGTYSSQRGVRVGRIEARVWCIIGRWWRRKWCWWWWSNIWVWLYIGIWLSVWDWLSIRILRSI